MRTNRRPLRGTHKTQARRAAVPNFLHWLNYAMRDERWRAIIRDRLIHEELAEIQF